MRNKDQGAAPPLSPERLSEGQLQGLEGALRAATPAPWRPVGCFVVDDASREMAECLSHDEAAAVAALRNAASPMLEEIRAARTRIAALEEALRNIMEAQSWVYALDDIRPIGDGP